MTSSFMRKALVFTRASAAIFSSLAALALSTPATVSADAPVKSLGMVTVNSGQPTSLPTQIPTTIEGVTGEQIEQTINATDSEDALKYFPSLLVRKRYIGNQASASLGNKVGDWSWFSNINSTKSSVQPLPYDLRVRYRVNKQWTAALGIDNPSN